MKVRKKCEAFKNLLRHYFLKSEEQSLSLGAFFEKLTNSYCVVMFETISMFVHAKVWE